MWSEFIQYFKGFKFTTALEGLQLLSNILDHLEENYKEDSSAKNILIDTMIQILQEHKDKTGAKNA